MSPFTLLCLSLLVPVTYQMLNRQLPPMATRVRLAGGRHECLPLAVGYPALDPDDPENIDPGHGMPQPPPRPQRR